MIYLLFQGQIERFVIILIVMIISLSFHEFGHAWTAKKFCDNTAERMGRLTLNPIVHIDPMGLLMIMTIGFGFAKPVPTNPRNFNSYYASAWVSAAGPGMNLILAFISINVLVIAHQFGFSYLTQVGPRTFLEYMTFINLLLMIFNLLPIGPLDGHYILPYFLSKQNAYKYRRLNDQYGSYALMGLVILSFIGIPIFSFLIRIAQSMTKFLIVF